MIDFIFPDPGHSPDWRPPGAERVPAVSSATGIPKHLLRPDLFDRPDAEGRAA